MDTSFDPFTWATDLLGQVPEPLAWVLGGVFSFVEAGVGVGLVFPGETAIVVLAAAMRTVPGVLVLALTVAVGASAGDHIGYVLGRRLGPRMRDWRVVRRLGVRHWDRAIALFGRRGGWMLVPMRFVPVVRLLMPGVAGAAGLSYRRFLAASVVGAIAWSVANVGLGYLLRSSLDALHATLGQVHWVAGGALVAGLAAVLVVRAARRRAARAPTGERVSVGTAELRIGVPGPHDADRPRGTP